MVKFCQFLSCFHSEYGLKILSPTSPISIVTWSAIYVATEKFSLSNRMRKRKRKTESVDSLVRLWLRLFFPI